MQGLADSFGRNLPMELTIPLSDPPAAASELEALLDDAYRLADRGDVRAGRALAEQALAQARARNDGERTARALAILANASRGLADYELAAAAALECVGLLQAVGAGVAPAKIDLALVFLRPRRLPEALSYLGEARRELAQAPMTRRSAMPHAGGPRAVALAEFELARVVVRAGARAPTRCRGSLRRRNHAEQPRRRASSPPQCHHDERGARVEFETALDYFHQARELAFQHADERLALLTEINMRARWAASAPTAGARAIPGAAFDRPRAGDRHNES